MCGLDLCGLDVHARMVLHVLDTLIQRTPAVSLHLVGYNKRKKRNEFIPSNALARQDHTIQVRVWQCYCECSVATWPLDASTLSVLDYKHTAAYHALLNYVGASCRALGVSPDADGDISFLISLRLRRAESFQPGNPPDVGVKGRHGRPALLVFACSGSGPGGRRGLVAPHDLSLRPANTFTGTRMLAVESSTTSGRRGFSTSCGSVCGRGTVSRLRRGHTCRLARTPNSPCAIPMYWTVYEFGFSLAGDGGVSASW